MLYVRLFGTLDIRCGDDEFGGCTSRKSRELFVYLLLHRDRPHAREKLASLLWDDHYSTVQSRKYLRNALWQLRSTLSDRPELAESRLLHVEPDWIQLNSVSTLQMDVETFEAAYAAVEGISGERLAKPEAGELGRALDLYQNDLLESWYQEWCLCERERLLQMYLIMLDKMMAYCEAHRQFEKGLRYGREVLRRYRARESTHRRMMRLYYLGGDRSSALRQYEQCVTVLRDELDVEPSQRTTSLYELLRTDELEASSAARKEQTGREEQAVMEEALRTLRTCQTNLKEIQHRLERTTETVETLIRRRRSASRRNGPTRDQKSEE